MDLIAIENLLLTQMLTQKRFTDQYLEICRKIHEAGFNSVEFHQKWLGKPHRRQRLEFLFSIWGFSTTTVPLTLYVNNTKGICIEVPHGASNADAQQAFSEYRKRVLQFLRGK